MRKNLRTSASALAFSVALLASMPVFGYDQAASGVFGQNPNTPAANTNAVDKSATASPNDVNTFSNAVAAAWAADRGGVYDLPTLSGTANTIFRATYGQNNSKRLTVTSSVNLQAVGWPPSGSFNPVSYQYATCQSADSSSYSLAIGPITDPLTDAVILSEQVTQIGLVILSRTHATQYPSDIRLTAYYSDGTTEAATANVGNVRGADDTFYGFTAPEGAAITNLLIQCFVPGTETLRSTRMAFDDLGFITSPTGVLPPPQIADVSPPNGLIIKAATGVSFVARSAAEIEPAGISLWLNGVDVSSQLVISGEATNRQASVGGLVADTVYDMIISVSNAAGEVSLTNWFFTAENELVLYDSGGFSDSEIYPLGALQATNHGYGTWVPATEPAEIVDTGDPTYGKALQRMQMGADRVDLLRIPGVANGVVTYSFHARTSDPAVRTLDMGLGRLTGPTPGSAIASFLSWGTVADKFCYYDGTAWVPVADMDTGWHHFKVVEYLSGVHFRKYDLYVDNVLVGEKLPWRTAIDPVATPLGRIRIGAIRGDVIKYGEVDNLIVTIAPEPYAPLPTTLVNPQHSGLAFSFAFTSQEDSTNYVEYATELPPTQWHPLETILGDGSVKTVTDPNPGAERRYYRIRTE